IHSAGPDIGIGPQVVVRVEQPGTANGLHVAIDLARTPCDDQRWIVILRIVANREARPAFDTTKPEVVEQRRTEERRVGKEGVSTCRSRGSPTTSKQK